MWDAGDWSDDGVSIESSHHWNETENRNHNVHQRGSQGIRTSRYIRDGMERVDRVPIAINYSNQNKTRFWRSQPNLHDHQPIPSIHPPPLIPLPPIPTNRTPFKRPSTTDPTIDHTAHRISRWRLGIDLANIQPSPRPPTPPPKSKHSSINNTFSKNRNSSSPPSHPLSKFLNTPILSLSSFSPSLTTCDEDMTPPNRSSFYIWTTQSASDQHLGAPRSSWMHRKKSDSSTTTETSTITNGTEKENLKSFKLNGRKAIKVFEKLNFGKIRKSSH